MQQHVEQYAAPLPGQMRLPFDESKHPRAGKGTSAGGQFTAGHHGATLDVPKLSQRYGFKAEISGSDNQHVHITSTHGKAKVPRASLQQFHSDLTGDYSYLQKHGLTGNAYVDAVLLGHGKMIGKGHDSVVFQVGDKAVKASTTVPYHPVGGGTHWTPEQAMQRTKQQNQTIEKMRKEGVTGIPEQHEIQHGDKVFTVREYLQIPERFSEAQLNEARRHVESMHGAGYAAMDQLQFGVGQDGKVYHFDLGAAEKNPGDNANVDRQRDDKQWLRGMFRDAGVRYEPSEAELSEKAGFVLRHMDAVDGDYWNMSPSMKRIFDETLSMMQSSKHPWADYMEARVYTSDPKDIEELGVAIQQYAAGSPAQFMPVDEAVTKYARGHVAVDCYSPQDWQQVQQSVHSEGTSLNQVPALHKKLAGKLRGVNVDIGGGAYDKATQFLAQHGVKNLVYDPYNRPAQHNQQVKAAVAGGRADSATIANVLNVIPEPQAQLQVLREAADSVRAGGTVYIDVHEGNRSGHPEKTSRGFQQNKPLEAYLQIVRQVFPNAQVQHGMIVAQNGGAQQYARPTKAQAEAGNYKMKHIRWQGLKVAIENPKGSVRSGDGWEVTMKCDYGYINGTEGRDGDQVDIFIGPDKKSDIVFIVDQVDQNGKFDEHKIVAGYSNEAAAKKAYLSNYEPGWKCGKIRAMTVEQLKRWLDKGSQDKPVSEWVDKYAKKLGPAAGQMGMFGVPTVSASGAQKKLFREDLHPRVDKGIGNAGQFQKKYGGGQPVRVVDHGGRHVAHVQHPKTGVYHTFEGRDHGEAVTKAAAGAQKMGFVIDHPKQEPELGGLFAGQKQAVAPVPKPQRRVVATPPKTPGHGGLFADINPSGIDPKEGDTRQSFGKTYVLRQGRWHKVHDSTPDEMSKHEARSQQQKAAEQQQKSAKQAMAQRVTQDAEKISDQDAAKMLHDMGMGGAAKGMGFDAEAAKKEMGFSEKPVKDMSLDELTAEMNTLGEAMRKVEMQEKIRARAKEREQKYGVPEGTKRFIGPPQPTQQQRQHQFRLEENARIAKQAEERKAKEAEAQQAELDANFMKPQANQPAEAKPAMEETPGFPEQDQLTGEWVETTPAHSLPHSEVIKLKQLKHHPIIIPPSKAEDWNQWSSGPHTRKFFGYQQSPKDQQEAYLGGLSENEAFQREQYTDARYRPAAIRVAMDFGDKDVTAHMMADKPIDHIPPIPYAAQYGLKTVKNTTKPGEFVTFTHHDGSQSIARVERRKGKQQTLRIIKPSETASDARPGTKLDLHADMNSSFLGYTPKSEIPKIVPPIGASKQSWSDFEDGEYKGEGDDTGLFAPQNVEDTWRANVKAEIQAAKSEQQAFDDDEPFKLEPPRPGRKQEKFETAPSGPQGSLFDKGENDLEGQNLLFNTDPGAGDDPTTMESKMKAEGRTEQKPAEDKMDRAIRMFNHNIRNVDTDTEPGRKTAQDAAKRVAEQHGVDANALFTNAQWQKFEAGAKPAESERTRTGDKKLTDEQYQDMIAQARGWNHAARQHEGTLPDNKAKREFARTTGKSDLDKWLMDTHGLSDTQARGISNKAGEEGPAEYGGKLPKTHWSKSDDGIKEIKSHTDDNGMEYKMFTSSQDPEGHVRVRTRDTDAGENVGIKKYPSREAADKDFDKYVGENKPEPSESHSETLEAAKPFVEYGPDYDRNIDTSYRHYLSAKKRGHSDKMLNSLHDELKLRVDARREKESAGASKWAENHIKIAADDISKLRKPDVYRVLDAAPKAKRKDLAKWINENRPELADEVKGSIEDIDRDENAAKERADKRAGEFMGKAKKAIDAKLQAGGNAGNIWSAIKEATGRGLSDLSTTERRALADYAQGRPPVEKAPPSPARAKAMERQKEVAKKEDAEFDKWVEDGGPAKKVEPKHPFEGRPRLKEEYDAAIKRLDARGNPINAMNDMDHVNPEFNEQLMRHVRDNMPDTFKSLRKRYEGQGSAFDRIVSGMVRKDMDANNERVRKEDAAKAEASQTPVTHGDEAATGEKSIDWMIQKASPMKHFAESLSVEPVDAKRGTGIFEGKVPRHMVNDLRKFAEKNQTRTKDQGTGKGILYNFKDSQGRSYALTINYKNSQAKLTWDHRGKEDVAADEAALKAGKETESKHAPGVHDNIIPHSSAMAAHRLTSHVPEKRGKQRQKEFVDQMNSKYDQMKKWADTPDKQDQLKEEWDKFLGRSKQKYLAALSADSKTASAMITGPANFPTRRNQKANDTARKRWDEYSEHIKKGMKAIKRKLRPEDAPKRIGDDGTGDHISKKIQSLEAKQEQFKAINKAVRAVINKKQSEGGTPDSRPELVFRKNHTMESAIKHIVESSGITEAQAKRFLEHDFAGRLGVPSYELTNNNAQIRRYKQQAAAQSRYESEAAKVKEETGGESQTRHAFEGGQVHLDYDDNRIRIQHDEKPDAETRKKLKENGFRWSRQNSAWQRQLTPNAKRAAEIVTGVSYDKRIESEDYCRRMDELTDRYLSDEFHMVEHYAERGSLHTAGRAVADALVSPWGRYGNINRLLKQGMNALADRHRAAHAEAQPAPQQRQRPQRQQAQQRQRRAELPPRSPNAQQVEKAWTAPPEPTAFERQHGLQPGEETKLRQNEARRNARAAIKGETADKQATEDAARQAAPDLFNQPSQPQQQPEGSISDRARQAAGDRHRARHAEARGPNASRTTQKILEMAARRKAAGGASFAPPAGPSGGGGGPSGGGGSAGPAPAGGGGPSMGGIPGRFKEDLHPRGGKGTRQGGQFVKKGTSGDPVSQGGGVPTMSPQEARELEKALGLKPGQGQSFMAQQQANQAAQQQKAMQRAQHQEQARKEALRRRKEHQEMDALGLRVNGQKVPEHEAAKERQVQAAEQLPKDLAAQMSQEQDQQASMREFHGKQAKAKAIRDWVKQKAEEEFKKTGVKPERQGNYTGKEVQVDGRKGKIVGHPFGKHRVQFPDGTESVHHPDELQPWKEPAGPTPEERQVSPIAQTGSSYFAPEAIEAAEKEAGAYKSRSKVIQMSPDEFLSMAESLDNYGGPSPEKTKGVSELMKSGTKFNSLPNLVFSFKEGEGSAQVVGHEGRHRARALKAAGVKTMPVVLEGPIRWGQQAGNDPFDVVKGDWPKTLHGQSGGQMPFPVPDLRKPKAEAPERQAGPTPEERQHPSGIPDAPVFDNGASERLKAEAERRKREGPSAKQRFDQLPRPPKPRAFNKPAPVRSAFDVAPSGNSPDAAVKAREAGDARFRKAMESWQASKSRSEEVRESPQAAIKRVAMDNELDHIDLFQAAEREHELAKQQHQLRETIKADARKSLGINAKTIDDIENSRSRLGGDASDFRGLDTYLQEKQGMYPEFDWGSDPASTLSSLVQEGVRPEPQLHDEDILNSAADYLRRNRQGWDDAPSGDPEGYIPPEERDDYDPDDPDAVPFARELGVESMVERYVLAYC